MKNELKIELFDSITKEKQNEVIDYNYVAPMITTMLKRLSRKTLMASVYNVNSPEDIDVSALNTLFNWMFLTTDTSEINPSVEYFIGQVLVGKASRRDAYAGTDITTGTINFNECYSTGSKNIFVFDFATDKANGTFRSILFASTLNGGRNHYGYTLKSRVLHNCGFAKSNSFYYGLNSTTLNVNNCKIVEYDKNSILATGNIISITGAPTDKSYALYATYNELACDNNNFYIACHVAYDGNYIMKFSNTGVFISKVKVTSSGNSAEYVLCSIYYHSDNYLYFSYSFGTLMMRISTDLTLGVSKSTGITYGASLFEYDGVFGLVNASGQLYKYDWNTGSPAISTIYSLPNTGTILPIDNNTFIISTSVVCRYWYADVSSDGGTSAKSGLYILDLSKVNNIGSRILLPAPVTKLNTQTMKITYTINFN